jgi:hypothetical protein
VAETRVKRLLCCGYRRRGKVMGQVYQCWWRICGEVIVFSKFEYHIFLVLYLFVTYNDSSSYMHTLLQPMRLSGSLRFYVWRIMRLSNSLEMFGSEMFLGNRCRRINSRIMRRKSTSNTRDAG